MKCENETDKSKASPFIQQSFIQYLLSIRHCSRHEAYRRGQDELSLPSRCSRSSWGSHLEINSTLGSGEWEGAK